MAYNLEDGMPSFVIEVDFLKGEKGDTGFSPRIEIASLTSAEYILKIVNEDGEFYTPNLKSDLSLDDYVKKEEGKGLSTNSFENEEKTKLQELHNYDDTELRNQVSGLIDTIGDINSFEVEVVDALPTEVIKLHTIYFVPKEQEEMNVYDEYMYINDVWEHIGTSKVDLSDYAKADDLSKDYTETNILADTKEGYGTVHKVYGKTTETGTGEKSPDNPYTIECVGDDFNLFNENGETTDKYINNSGQEIAGTLYVKQTITNIEKKYVIGFKNYIGNPSVMLAYYDNGTFISRESSNTKGYVFTVPNNTTKIDIRVNIDSQNKFNELKLQKGEAATTWSPYKKGTVEVKSSNGSNTSYNIIYVDKPLCRLKDTQGNVIAQDYIDYNRGKILRECNYNVFDGSDDEDWMLQGTNVFYLNTPFSNAKPSDNIANITSNVQGFNLNSSEKIFISNTNRLNLKTDKIEHTLNAIRNYLKSINMIVVYQLATPTEEDIQCSNKIQQYDGTTTIESNAEVEVTLTNNKAIAQVNENIRKLEETNIMTAVLENDLTFGNNAFASSPLIPLREGIKIGNQLFIENGGIKIGKGVKNILVSANMRVTNSLANKQFGIQIRRNLDDSSRFKTIQGGLAEVIRANSNYSSSIGNILVDVQEGDIIYLNCFVEASDTYKAIASYTNLTVQAVG